MTHIFELDRNSTAGNETRDTCIAMQKADGREAEVFCVPMLERID